MYSSYTHVDYGNGIIWELMFGPEGFWDFIRSLRVFFGGGGVEYPPGDYSSRRLWLIFCHLGGGDSGPLTKVRYCQPNRSQPICMLSTMYCAGLCVK